MKRYLLEIGKVSVAIEVVRALGQDAIDFKAACEGQTATSRMTLHPKANKTRQQLEKNMEDHARRLAESLAGRVQSRSLLKSIFDQTPEG